MAATVHRWDLLITGGTVLDPVTGSRQRLDVAVDDGKVVAIAPGLDSRQAVHTVDACHSLVVPGLVDAHCHAFHGFTYWGVDVAALSPAAGVTTWIDAGSAGPFSVDGFAAQAAALPVRVFALLNISSVGLTAPSYELQLAGLVDAAAVVAAARALPDFVVGVKVRADEATTGEQGLAPLLAGLQIADELGLPLMAHIGVGPPSGTAVLEVLRQGDVLTHCATTRSGGVASSPRALHAARERGVIFDVGHGGGSFSFAQAEELIRSDAAPQIISTDVHALSWHQHQLSLPLVMSKWMAVGMPLETVLHAVTRAPADAFALPGGVGRLAVGARADLAVLQVADGRFTYFDTEGVARVGSARIDVRHTIAGGKILGPCQPPVPPRWAAQAALLALDTQRQPVSR